MAYFEFAICGQMGRVMSADSPTSATRPPATRSRVTNGSQLLPTVDGRSIWARRMRDLMGLHLDDLGGAENTSEAERSIVRRVAVIETELEYQEAQFAELRQAGKDPSEKMLDLYSRLAGNLRRLLESIGLKRRARDITPNVAEWIEQQGDQL